MRQKPSTKTRQPDDPEQSKRFIEAAREAEAAETKEEADRAFRQFTAFSDPKTASELGRKGGKAPRKSK